MKASETNHGWAPVLRPDGTFCSPRCGCRCTKEQHDQAQRLGAGLAARMGPGWQPHVWENGHWWYAAMLTQGDLEVRVHHGYPYGKGRELHRDGIDEYTVLLNAKPQFTSKHIDPLVALRQALDEYDAFLKDRAEFLAFVRKGSSL